MWKKWNTMPKLPPCQSILIFSERIWRLWERKIETWERVRETWKRKIDFPFGIIAPQRALLCSLLGTIVPQVGILSVSVFLWITQIPFTLHLSLGIPCVYRGFRGWMAQFPPSSPFITLHHPSSPFIFSHFFCKYEDKVVTLRYRF